MNKNKNKNKKETKIVIAKLKGAIPASRVRLVATAPHKIVGTTPPQFLWFPKQIDMWGNATFGDCVTAEEAFAKACNNPEIFIPDHKIIEWARNNFVLNGAGLCEVMDLMIAKGIGHDDHTYFDGPFKSVNWANEAILQNAIAQGPVKIGISSNQLENAVWQTTPYNGWIATGFTEAAAGPQDHCVSLCGYGTFLWLAGQMGTTLPASVDGAKAGYALFTWQSIGIIDFQSVSAICGEAWLRSPTTIIQ